MVTLEKKIYKNLILKSFFGQLCLGLSFNLYAQDSKNEPPEPLAWVQGLPATLWSNTPGLMSNIYIRERFSKDEKPIPYKWDIFAQSISKLGFIQFIGQKDAEFYERINKAVDVKPGESKELAPWLQSSTSFVLEFRKKKAIIKGQKDDKLVKLASWRVSQAIRRDPVKLLKWLVKNLNYDAVVLDYRKPFVLVNLLEDKDKLGQGLLLKDSDKQVILKKDERTGQAILQWIKSEGHFAVFEVLFTAEDINAITPGSKIAFGEKLSLKKNPLSKSLKDNVEKNPEEAGAVRPDIEEQDSSKVPSNKGEKDSQENSD